MNPHNNISNPEKGSDKKLKERFGNKMPYDLPDGYFDELSGRMLDACKSKDTTVPGKRFIPGGFKKMLAAAAIVLFTSTLISIVFMNRPREEDPLQEYSVSEMYQSINSLVELEDSYLLSWIENDSLKSLKVMDDGIDNISDAAIIDYLLAENHIEYHIINENY